MKKILLILCLSLIFIGSLICEEKNVFVSKIENLSDKLVIEGFNDSYLYETKDGNLFLSMILYVEKIYGVKPSFFKFGWDDSTVSGQFYLLLDKEKKIIEMIPKGVKAGPMKPAVGVEPDLWEPLDKEVSPFKWPDNERNLYTNGTKCALWGRSTADMSQENLVLFVGYLDALLGQVMSEAKRWPASPAGETKKKKPNLKRQKAKK